MAGANLADIIEAPALLDHAPSAEVVIADKGYDASVPVEQVGMAGARPSSRSGRTAKHPVRRIHIAARPVVSSTKLTAPP